MKEKFIKGMFPHPFNSGKRYPIVAGDSKCKEGELYVFIDTVKKDNKPDVVRCFMQTWDTDGNETGDITMLMTHETVKELFEDGKKTLFDSKYKIQLDENYSAT